MKIDGKWKQSANIQFFILNVPINIFMAKTDWIFFNRILQTVANLDKLLFSCKFAAYFKNTFP